MNKNQKIIIIGGSVVVALLIGLMIFLIVRDGKGNSSDDDKIRALEMTQDSLKLANDQLVLTNEFDQLNAEFSQYEGQQVYLKNDSLVQQYNQSRAKVQQLLDELEREKKNNKRDNARSQARIRELEAEIGTLKGIVKHYLEEIKRLGEENEGLRNELAQANERYTEAASQASAAQASNERLSQTVKLAKKLNITALTLRAYNRKDKPEKKVNKAAKFGVSFSVSPNNTASAGMKTIYVRVLTPEGTLLGGGASFNYDGSNVAASASRQIEYANDEVPVSIYVPVTTTLTAGDYRVEVFCDGYRLGSKSFTLEK
ncbi:MAG: hypothetical protein NC201_00760 [Prevotella sp.]|nr:hypothetical protein [Bacteroides sp.]MCM1365759.1 hypothetical protein [Prevotella sp.]MCM1436429.1 hypothetical protein [Prevotella sp.]